MQCVSCKAELPKKAKKCPSCGIPVIKKQKNVKVLAIAGAVIAFIGGLLPFVQNTEEIKKAYSYMNIYDSFYWYAFMLLLVASIVLVAVKKEIFSLITTGAAAVVYAVSLFVPYYMDRVARGKFEYYKLTDLVGDGAHEWSFGLIVVIVGLVIAIGGCFIDIMKYFKKELNVDARFMSNSLNKNIWKKMWYYRGFYIMFIPVFIFILIFNYLPMAGIRFAFTDYIIRDPYYVGIKHFAQMFTKDLGFWTAFKNTMFLSIIKLALNTAASVVISLLLHEIVTLGFKKTVQTIVYLPHFMSWVVVASLFTLILAPDNGGLVNSFLLKIGVIEDMDHAIFFLGKPEYWTGSYYFINIWKDTGWGTVLFLATLSGISPELYEAAQIDGANRWNRMRYITFPALANTIVTVFILNLAKVMNLFESVFVLQNYTVIDVSDVLQTYIYRKTFGVGSANYGYTTAVGIFRSVVSCILVLGCNWASKKVRGRGIV